VHDFALDAPLAGKRDRPTPPPPRAAHSTAYSVPGLSPVAPPVQSLSLARLTRIRAERVPHPRGNPVEDTLPFQAAIRYATGIYYPRIADAPTSAFIAARKVLSPGFYEPQPVSEHLCSSTPQKPYRQQSLLTKQRTRLTRLRTRLLIKTPLFFFEAYQEKLSENPEYYGVCVIEGLCHINPGQRLGWIAQERAIARENELRAQGW